MLYKSQQILFNHNIGEGYYLIGFSCPELAGRAQPGQFVMLRMADQAWEGKLSRPFGVSNVKDDVVEIVLEVVGRCTRNLAAAEKGRELDVVGPLGNGFNIDKEAEVHFLVAGGIGIATFPYLGIRILQECPKSKIAVLLGVRSASKLFFEKHFREYDLELEVSSDDGTVGYHGLVTELLTEKLDSLEDVKPAIYACGPEPMLKAAASIASDRNISCQLLLEEIMACGVGACLGCARKVREGKGWTYKMVCKDGPVFDSKDVIFDED